MRDLLKCKSSKMLKKIRYGWEKKTAKQKVEFIYKIPNYALRYSGGRILEDNKRIWYVYNGYVTITIYFSVAAYTIFYHSVHNKSLKFLDSVCSSGMAVSVSDPIIIIQLSVHLKLKIIIIFSWLHCICLVWPMGSYFVGLSHAE